MKCNYVPILLFVSVNACLRTQVTDPTAKPTEPPTCKRRNPSDVQVYVEAAPEKIPGPTKPSDECTCFTEDGTSATWFIVPSFDEVNRYVFEAPIGDGLTYSCPKGKYYISDGTDCYENEGNVKQVTFTNFCPNGAKECKPKVIIHTDEKVTFKSGTKPDYESESQKDGTIFKPLDDEGAYLTADMFSCERCPQRPKSCGIPKPLLN
uniref:Secreted protein n=1 Tax=Steinernema glaseri TaxID=37863 RepID=A0A1I7YCR4_9BILA